MISDDTIAATLALRGDAGARARLRAGPPGGRRRVPADAAGARGVRPGVPGRRYGRAGARARPGWWAASAWPPTSRAAASAPLEQEALLAFAERARPALSDALTVAELRAARDARELFVAGG